MNYFCIFKFSRDFSFVFFFEKKYFTYLGTDESDGSKSVAVAASLSEPSGESVMPSSISRGTIHLLRKHL